MVVESPKSSKIIMNIYEKHPASIDDWVTSYQSAKGVMNFSSDVDLSFERLSSLASTIIPAGGILSGDEGIRININPYLIEIDTSENLRQFVYSHELGEIRVLDSSIAILFNLTRLVGFFIPPISYTGNVLKEKYVNKKVYHSICEITNPDNAFERMHKFVEEWLALRPEGYGMEFKNVDEYVKLCMPFLMQD
jgi:hypothetical protein